MNDLPRSLPALRVIERYLVAQLAEVHAELEAAEDAAAPRWWVQWRRTPPGAPWRGVLHRAGCWLPGGPDLRAGEVRAVVAEHGGRIEECAACRARVP
ncbi:hypothetical protein RM780_04100 [Streptomyces sp. DSM 44917]|uniref:Uncharacterized protein n=1 Tax=Streptomyces boetiae TaxID=3075541 RepID=A0ABU2L3L2_9ACTN|nr:hypothetical protein [Streptomyces sp. DSM 44917]MDT0306145.1 hypothetical protein [Streptomyces sp. DSM 44917]